MTDLMLEALNALDVLAVLTETRPGNVRLNALDTLTRALKVVRADAQALADVRTLDARAERIGKPVAPCPDGDGRWFIADAGTNFTGATPDEARAKAAEWVRKQAKAPT